jgi:hypothetical protein
MVLFMYKHLLIHLDSCFVEKLFIVVSSPSV